MEQNERSRMLGTMPMGKLVPKVSIPIMISMLIQALHNVVDSIFVARYDPNALTAVSLAFPVQNLLIGLATGTAVGVNALLSKSLGEKNFKKAKILTKKCNNRTKTAHKSLILWIKMYEKNCCYWCKWIYCAKSCLCYKEGL